MILVRKIILRLYESNLNFFAQVTCSIILPFHYLTWPNLISLGSISPMFYKQLLRQYYFAKRIQSQTVSTKSCSKHICTKKPVVKCWWNWPLAEFCALTSILYGVISYAGSPHYKFSLEKLINVPKHFNQTSKLNKCQKIPLWKSLKTVQTI